MEDFFALLVLALMQGQKVPVKCDRFSSHGVSSLFTFHLLIPDQKVVKKFVSYLAEMSNESLLKQSILYLQNYIGSDK